MLHSEAFTVTTEDGLPLFVQQWHSTSRVPTQKVLFILHGYGEHGGRYQHVPTYLAEIFDTFYAMDLRGHGRSGGTRGYVHRFDQYLSDIQTVVDQIQKQWPKKHLWLLAHSFGALIALRMLLCQHPVPFEGAILSAPCLGLKLRVPLYKKLAAKILLHTLPKLQLTDEIDPTDLSHDLHVAEAYVQDKLVHHKMTSHLYYEFMRMMQWVSGQTGSLTVPSLFLIPGSDKIVDSQKSLQFFRNLKSRDKFLVEYPEMYHEILNEVFKEKVFEDMKQWIFSKNSINLGKKQAQI